MSKALTYTRTARSTSAQERSSRCAVYTRTSTDDGLDQAFNSLDAQREACIAYVQSQGGEGWRLIPKRYDDGGHSGGNLDRPALKTLLQDIEAGLIDIVVVYKIDRLTRSLADFAKIVDRLDARKASFVSVTQSFNTTSSMGRLTLNVLLSFAQFERELGAERVRDKIAASKKKGMWMGGTPPLGYDIAERCLVINPEEADTARWIFRRYLELKSLPRLKAEVVARGITTKRYAARTGRVIGGSSQWHIGLLQHMLRNRLYVGEVVHDGQNWPGQHEALVERTLFDAVQEQLSSARPARRGRPLHTYVPWLTGFVRDDQGHRMSPQTTTKRRTSKAYVYYVSQAHLQRLPNPGSRSRVQAEELESLVGETLKICLQASAPTASSQSPSIASFADSTAPDLRLGHTAAWREIADAHLRKIVVAHGHITIDLAGLAISSYADLRRALVALSVHPEVTALPDGELRVQLDVLLEGGARHRREDGAVSGPSAGRRFDPALVRALVHAHAWRRALESGGSAAFDDATRASAYGRTTARKLLRLAFAAPDLQQAILEGRQDGRLTVRRLLRHGFPASWRAQSALFSAMPGEDPRRISEEVDHDLRSNDCDRSDA